MRMSGPAILEVTSTELEFRVEGTDRIIHYGDEAPFSTTTNDWNQALEWFKELVKSNSQTARCTIIKSMLIRGSDKPAKQEVMTFSGENFGADDVYKNLLETEHTLKARLETLQEKIRQTEKQKQDFVSLKEQLSALGLIL